MISWLSRRLGLTAADPAALQEFRSDDPHLRQRAAEQLATLEDPRAIPALLKLLTDPVTAVRQAAQAGLRAVGERAVDGLLEGLNHANTDLGQTCAELLGHIKAPEAIGPLILTLKFGARPVQLACRSALQQFGAAARVALEEARSETQPWVREQIESLLRHLPAAPPHTPTPDAPPA